MIIMRGVFSKLRPAVPALRSAGARFLGSTSSVPAQINGESAACFCKSGYGEAGFFGATVGGLGLLLYQNKNFLKVQAQEEVKRGELARWTILRRSQSEQVREFSKSTLPPTTPLDSKVRAPLGDEKIWVANRMAESTACDLVPPTLLLVSN